MQAISSDMMGGRTLVSLRAVSAIFGSFTVLALYSLAQSLLDRKTALIAAALLATFPPHVHFSRLGLNNVADPFFGTLALYFIGRGLRRNMRANFAWGGVSLGLTQYFYEGGRLLFPPLALGWLMALGGIVSGAFLGALLWGWLRIRLQEYHTPWDTLIHRTKAVKFRRIEYATMILGVATVIVGSPIYLTLLGQERDLFVRMDAAGMTEDLIYRMDMKGFLTHIGKHLNDEFMMHIGVPEFSLFYAGKTPLLLGALAVFFLLGIGTTGWHLFRRDHRAGSLLILLWILLTWLGNALLVDSRMSPRYVVAFPPVILATALGLRGIVGLIAGGSSPSGEGKSKRTAIENGVLIVLTAVLVTMQGAYYFGAHIEIFLQQTRDNMGRDFHDVLFRSLNFPSDTHIYLVSSRGEKRVRDAVALMRYLDPSVTIYAMSSEDFNGAFLDGLNYPRHRAFFVEPDDVNILGLLITYFPDVQGPFFSPQDIAEHHQFALFFVDPVAPM